MKNIAVKGTVMFILLIMMLYDVGGKPEEFDEEARSYLIGFVVAFYIGCYFLLKYFFRVQEGKQWLKSYTTLKSIVASICLVLLVRAAIYGSISLCCGNIYGLFARADKADTETTPPQAQATGESFDPATGTYFNHDYRFSFKLPEGWLRNDTLQGREIFTSHSPEKHSSLDVFSNTANLETPDVPILKIVTDMEAYMQMQSQAMEAKGHRVKKATCQKAQISNRGAIRIDLILEINLNGEPAEMHRTSYTTIKGTNLFMVQVMTRQASYEANPGYYDNLINHFAFTD